MFNEQHKKEMPLLGMLGLGGGIARAISASAMTATGGIINDYEISGTYYRSHVFTSSGTFVVDGADANVEYLVVAGGGGGGGDSQSGGGGAGGFRTNLTGHPVKAADYTVTAGSYTVTVGGGGGGGTPSGTKRGQQGGNSEFYPTPVSYPSTARVRSVGGGGGQGYAGSPGSPTNGGAGGSGGGSFNKSGTGTGGAGNTPTDPNHPQVQGYKGGDSPTYVSPYQGGGGGGAGGEGAPDNPADSFPGAAGRSQGGYGLQALIAGPPASDQPVGTPGPSSGKGYFAGGGGGGGYQGYPEGAAGGYGGGGSGGTGNPGSRGNPATISTGGGGGGSRGANGGPGGNGASGIVIIRYQLSESTGTAKASGGNISYYGGKTIHTFTSSGNFVTPGSFNETVEYVVVGGGGAGGGPSASGVNSYYGGGGGAGTIKKNSIPISTPQTIAVTIGAGGSKGRLLPAGGSDSFFGPTIPAPGGGYGSTWQDPGGQPTVAGGPGGSSGGSSYGGSVQPSTGDNFSPVNAAANTPNNGWGHPGGSGHPSGNSGGGGGAGGGGGIATGTVAGQGGVGMQLPATFRNPTSTVGAPGPTNIPADNPGWQGIDNSGKFWVAAGGGGSSYGPSDTYTSGTGGGNMATVSGPHGGAGNGSRYFAGGTAALQNTGSGGGGMERANSEPVRQPDAGNGGSGLVLIAYPT